jgi:carbon-monoxide dehydrogenase large subunit
MDDAMTAAGWAGFEARRADTAKRGRLRGIGMSTYVEICGFQEEEATVHFLEDGTLEILIGTQSSGQGHATAYAQIAADGLGIPMEQIRVVQGDTDRVPFGKGTGGSRSLPVGGPALQNAVDALIEHGTVFASHLLQARRRDIRFADGHFTVADSRRSIGIAQLAHAARHMENLPPGEMLPELRAVGRYASKASTFPNGCHICELEIDPETGAVELAAYHVVDDFGTIVNPMLRTGQVRGGVVQGIGQALREETVYDRDSGQLLSGSFLDYAVPHALHVPPIEVAFNCIPCTTNPLGIKGAGEAGTIAACPAVINAVVDALSPLGIRHIDMPATPEKLWRAIQAAQQSSIQEPVP